MQQINGEKESQLFGNTELFKLEIEEKKMDTFTDEELSTLTLLNKRIGFAEFNACAENEEQAYAMRNVFEKAVQTIQQTCEDRGCDGENAS